MIFLSVTSTIVGYGVYDRRECKRIRQEYVEKVQHLAEDRLDPLATPRTVTVYGAKWPGDDDYQQAMKYFRKYVKVSQIRVSTLATLCSSVYPAYSGCSRYRL